MQWSMSGMAVMAQLNAVNNKQLKTVHASLFGIVSSQRVKINWPQPIYTDRSEQQKPDKRTERQATVKNESKQQAQIEMSSNKLNANKCRLWHSNNLFTIPARSAFYCFCKRHHIWLIVVHFYGVYLFTPVVWFDWRIHFLKDKHTWKRNTAFSKSEQNEKVSIFWMLNKMNMPLGTPRHRSWTGWLAGWRRCMNKKKASAFPRSLIRYSNDGNLFRISFAHRRWCFSGPHARSFRPLNNERQ